MPRLGKLTTLAVGGLAAGEVITGVDGYARVHRPRPANVCLGDAPPKPEAMSISSSVYVYMALRYFHPELGERGFEFWVDPSEIHDEQELIAALAQGYRPTKRMEGNY